MSEEHTTGLTLEIHETTVDAPTLLDTLIDLYIAIFPEDRRYVPYICECAERAKQQDDPLAVIHQWVVTCAGKPVGLRLFNYLKRRNFAFGRYVGLLPPYRGMGIGRFIQERTIEQLHRDARNNSFSEPIGICGEVDDPALAKDERERRVRERRVQIFERLGAIWLDVNYIEPTMIRGIEPDNPEELERLEPKRRLFYLAPIQPISKPTPELTTELVKGVLIDNYRLSETSWYVRQALESIQRRQEVENQ